MRRDPPDMHSVSRLLVIKMSALGDIAKSIPTVDAVKAAYPHLRIGWIARRGFHDLLVGNPSIDELMVTGKTVRDLRRAAGEARRFRADVVLDMQGLWVSGCLARASGAPWRCTWESGREFSGVLTGNPVVPAPRTANAVECLFGFAHAVGVPEVPLRRPAYLCDPANLSEAAAQALGDGSEPAVGLHIGASEPNKSWPPEHWAALADALGAAGCRVILLGGPGDAAAGQDVEARVSGPLRSLVGRTTIRELAAVTARCAVFVGGDSGAAHIAALVQTPVVCLMGATSAARTGPYGPACEVIDLGLPCGPCYRRPTCGGTFRCMREIEPARVAEACRRRLLERAACA